MAGGNLDDDDGIVDINVTPLVDIMLVLLIIFMVASTYIVKPSIEVELPKAATGNEDLLDTTISVVITEAGELQLNGEPATEASIAETCREVKKAAEAGRSKDEPQAIISADKRTPHGRVVRIIDLVRRNGVLKFAINIDPEVVKASP